MNPFQIALTFIPGLGAKSIRQLLDICPDVEELFSYSKKQLGDIFGRHQSIIDAIANRTTLPLAEKEIAEMSKYGIYTLFFNEPDYPSRLNESGCEDTPVLLYCLGRCNLNAPHSVAFVGSRKCSDYGRTTTDRIVQELVSDNTLIVSGLAYGIDTAAHTAAVNCGLTTVAVLGHGLDTLYPSQNRGLAKRILDQGGALISEYPLHTAINAAYFPARNRIVAALSDAVVVVESAERGGALITANIANSYHREVFAVPGRLDDPLSYGCNNLIINNKAIMIRHAGDLYYQMGWSNTFNRKRQIEQQQSLFATLSDKEQIIVNLLTENHEMTLDEIVDKSAIPLPKIAALMMELELKNVVRCLPGRIYKLK